MKNAIFLLTLLILSITGFSQYPTYQQFGSPSTRTTFLGAADAQKGLINGKYSDTSVANTGHIDFYPGAQIVVGDIVYVRNFNATRWIPMFSFGSTSIFNIINNIYINDISWFDSSIVICNGAGACDTFPVNFNVSVSYFINDSVLLACDTTQVQCIGDSCFTTQVCDTIHIPAQLISIYQNGLREVFPGVRELGYVTIDGDPNNGNVNSWFKHHTTVNTAPFRFTITGWPVWNPVVQFYQQQTWGISSEIASFWSNGSGVDTARDKNNLVRLGINYFGRSYGTTNTDVDTGYMGDKIGYAITTNLSGKSSFGLGADDPDSKYAGILFHTFDNEYSDLITFFGSSSPGSKLIGPLEGSLILPPKRIMSLRHDKGMTLYGYTGSSFLIYDTSANKPLVVNTTTGEVGKGFWFGGGGGGINNANAGSAYRLLIPSTQEIKTLNIFNALTPDSATAGQIGIKLGGLMTENTTITGNQKSLSIANLIDLGISVTDNSHVGEYTQLDGTYDAMGMTAVSNDTSVGIVAHGGDKFAGIGAYDGLTNISNVRTYVDSVWFNQTEGKYVFSNVQTSTDTSNLDVAVFDQFGRLRKYPYFGGGGVAGWALTGNTGTTAGTNFIGTIDNVDWQIKTSNTLRATFKEWDKLELATKLFFTGTKSIHFFNNADSNNVSIDYGITAVNQLTINTLVNGGFLRINTGSPTGGGAIVSNGQYAITWENTPNVGIGTISPGFKLDVDGTFRATGQGRFDANLIVSGRMQEDKGANVASANDVTLGSDGNLFVITGSTQMNAITTTGWQNGSEVTFIFTGAPLVKNNTAGGAGTATILLTGRTDFQTAAGDLLTLKYDGTNWYEMQRALASSASNVNIYNSDGTILANRTVSTGGFTTLWSGTNDNETSFTVNNGGSTSAHAIQGTASGSSSVGVGGTSSSYIGVLGTSTSNAGVQGQSTSGPGVVGVSSSGFGMVAQINATGTNTVGNVFDVIRLSSSGAGANGIGAAIRYTMESATSGTTAPAALAYATATDATLATFTTSYVIQASNSGALVDRLFITGNGRVYTPDGGNLLIGGSTAAASATNSIHVYNGTIPSGSITNGVLLYSEDVAASAELKARDEAGNVITLSPHNFTGIPQGRSEEMAWAYYSERNGNYVNVDMLKLARLVEQMTGEKLVYEGKINNKPNPKNK